MAASAAWIQVSCDGVDLNAGPTRGALVKAHKSDAAADVGVVAQDVHADNGPELAKERQQVRLLIVDWQPLVTKEKNK